jgi:hypothetical protein
MPESRKTVRTLVPIAVGAFALLAGVDTGAQAAPALQTEARIVVVAYPDLVGSGAQPGCEGCDLQFTNGDSLASSADPLPLLEFILRDDTGAEVERRMTSALPDGRRPASFVVPAPGSFTVELAAVPTGWSGCPNDSTTKSVEAGDFDTDNRVQLDFWFWHGCTTQPTATTQPGQPTATTAPGQPTATRTGPTARPTSTRTPGPGGADDDDDDDATAAATGVPGSGGEIRGLVFIDLTQDGLLAADDPGLGPVVVGLTGQGRTSQITTPSSGTFSFANLAPGSYVVTVTAPAGYQLTTPGSRTITVADTVVMGADFGLFPVAGLQSLPVPPRTGPPPKRLPATGALEAPTARLMFGLATLVGLLALGGLMYERRSGQHS